MRKFFALAIALLATVPSLAAEEKVRARDFYCQDLQDLLIEKGSLYIVSFGSKFGNSHKADSQSCRIPEYGNPAYVTTADKTFCLVGYVCQRM